MKCNEPSLNEIPNDLHQQAQESDLLFQSLSSKKESLLNSFLPHGTSLSFDLSNFYKTILEVPLPRNCPCYIDINESTQEIDKILQMVSVVFSQSNSDIIQSIKYLSEQGCKCTKSNCLQLYCHCFGKMGYCHPTCNCVNCYNTKHEKNTIIRKESINLIKSKNEDAFKKFKLGNAGQLFRFKGCKCKKNCNNSRCSCHQYKVQCSSNCKCLPCFKLAGNPFIKKQKSKIFTNKKTKLDKIAQLPSFNDRDFKVNGSQN